MPIEELNDSSLTKAFDIANTVMEPDETDFPEIAPGVRFDPTGMMAGLSTAPKFKKLSAAFSKEDLVAKLKRMSDTELLAANQQIRDSMPKLSPSTIDVPRDKLGRLMDEASVAKRAALKEENVLGNADDFRSNNQTRAEMHGRAEADVALLEKRKRLKEGTLSVPSERVARIANKAEGRTPTATEQGNQLIDDFELVLHLDKNPDIADHIKQMADTPDGRGWLQKAQGPNGDFPIIRKLLSNK